MNIRLDRKSVRVRVSANEALALDRDGELTEVLPLSHATWVLRVTCVTDDALTFLGGSDGCLELRIPRVKLLAITQSLVRPRGNTPLDIRGCSLTPSGPSEVAFEVDRFSLKRAVE